MIRAVLDTNIVVSALLQPLGPPAQVLVLALSGSIQLCVSGSVYAEYEEVIRRPRFRRSANIIAATLKAIRENGIWVSPSERIRACSDPDDDMFLECALAAKAEYVVTGNLKHFPVSWAGNVIVTPRWLIENVSVVKRNRSSKAKYRARTFPASVAGKTPMQVVAACHGRGRPRQQTAHLAPCERMAMRPLTHVSGNRSRYEPCVTGYPSIKVVRL